MTWLIYLNNNISNISVALLASILIFLVLFGLKKRATKLIRLKIKDSTVGLFLVNAIYFLIIIMIVISLLARLGVPTASLLTVLGAGGLAIGLSLKNFLSHLAGGLILIGLKFFRVGDVVEINGVAGNVYQINLLHTVLKTENGDLIMIPNANIFRDKICKKHVTNAT